MREIDAGSIRERLALYGSVGLSELELLSRVVGESRASCILDGVNDLRWLLVAGVDELVSAGFPPRQAELFRASVDLALRLWQRAGYRERYQIRSPEDAYDLLKLFVVEPYQERFWVVPLDNKNYVQSVVCVAVGTVNTAVVTAREVYRIALRYGAASVITGHNHPSGDPTPSPEDIMLVSRITAAGDAMEIPHLDHIIVGNGVYTSLREMGRMRG